MRHVIRLAPSMCLPILLAAVVSAPAAPVSNAFTYQGQLLKGGTPYTGNADFVFRLYNDPAAGAQVGGDVSRTAVGVTGGVFTVELDFGAVFDGTARWLEVRVQTPGEGSATTLAPRQPLSAAPYALYALNAPSGGSSQWLNDPLGIQYSAGNVGVGIAAAPQAKLRVDTGTADLYPGWFSTQNPSYPVLATGNTGPNGWGIVDFQSPRHHFQGSIGIGTWGTTPPTAKVHVQGDPHIAAIHATTVGNAWAIVGYGASDPLAPFAGGVQGVSENGRAVEGRSTNSIGVVGDCVAAGTYGMLGTPDAGIFALSPTAAIPAARFRNHQSGLGLWVEGRARVSVLEITGGADLAEPFAVEDGRGIEPGAVVVIDETRPGGLRLGDQPYDSRVAGVISGANDLQPGMLMQAEGHEHASGDHPVALTGRVWCKVDASFGAVRPGDLLTTSQTPGHAMKAADTGRRAGAVLGKAMTGLKDGRGLVLALVSLQ